MWSATPVYQKLEEDVQIWNGNEDNLRCVNQLVSV